MNYRIKFLKVKIKSLAEESRIIRKEEQRAKKDNKLREELYLHRVKDVRDECRATHLAYGYLRGKPYKSMEPTTEDFWSSFSGLKIWERVQRMVAKYGESPIYLSSDASKKNPAFEKLKADLEEWRKREST